MRTCLLFFCLLLLYHNLSAQSPKLMLPIGHTGDVNYAEFSKDGKKIVTASLDKTAKIWDAQTGLLLANLRGHKGNVEKAVFDPSGLRILTVSDDGTAKVWNALTGISFATLSIASAYIEMADFSKDGSKILTLGSDSSVRIWSGSNYALTNTIKSNESIGFAEMNTAGNLVITKEADRLVRIWDITVPGGNPLYKTTREGHDVSAATFSPDGRSALIFNDDSTVRIWNYAANRTRFISGKIMYALYTPDNNRMVVLDMDNTIRLLNVFRLPNRSDSVVFVKKMDGRDGEVNAIDISPDGKRLVTMHDRYAFFWDITNMQTAPIGRIDLQYGLNGVKFNADGKKVVVAMADKIALVYDAESNGKELLLSLTGHTASITAERYSKDGTRILTACEDGIARIWDAQNGQLLKILKGHRLGLNSAEFSNDDKWIITASNDSTSKIWDAATGRLIATMPGHKDIVTYALFNPNTTRFVTGSADKTANLWQIDPATGKITYVKRLGPLAGEVKMLLFSPDGQRLATVTERVSEIQLWDANTGEWKGKIKQGVAAEDVMGNSDINGVLFTRDSKRLFTVAQGNMWGERGPQIWDGSDGHWITTVRASQQNADWIIMRLSKDEQKIIIVNRDAIAKILDANTFYPKAECAGMPEAPIDVEFSPNGQMVAMTFADNTAVIWDTNTGRKLRTFIGHADDVNKAMFSPDNKYLLTSSEDNTIKKWAIQTGELLYTFLAVDVADYLLIDRFERYDGTAAARKLLYFTCGTEVIELEQFKDLSWEPGLVPKIMGLSPDQITAKKITEIQICNVTPEVTQLPGANGNFDFQIKARNGGVGNVYLYVNGKQIGEYAADKLPKTDPVTYRLIFKRESLEPYFASGMANKVVVKASITNGSMTSRGGDVETGVINKKPGNTNMYILAVGINDYKGPALHLKYATTDATSFASAVSASARKLLNVDGKEHVTTAVFTTDEANPNKPNKPAIAQKIQEFAQLATADDILVIFFAGHGVMISGQKNLYLLTREASALELKGVEQTVSISTDELNQWMRNIKANKQILILDACNSGAAIGNTQSESTRRDMPADQIRALENLKDKTGTFILTASASGQSAFEASQYGQGLLTYSLLSTIKNQSALKENKFIDVTTWFNSASDNVRELAKEIGGRQDPQIIGAASFPVGLVDREVMDGIKLAAGKKKVFSRSSLYDAGDAIAQIDGQDVAVEIDRELNNQSALGINSPISFIENNTSPEAYSVRGVYEVKNNIITARFSLIREKKRIGTEMVMTGATNQKTVLAKKIVAEILKLLAQQ